MGELLHGEESKSRIRHGLHTAKDGFLLLDVDWHFSKLKLASNGVEDQSRALGNSCSSLSLSRNRSLSPKPESPRIVAEILLKRRKSRLTRLGWHGRAAHPVARVSQNAAYHLVEFQALCTARMARPCELPFLPVFALAECGTANPATCTAVWVFCSARVCSRRIPHGQAIPSHGRVNIRAARVTSFVTCLAPDLRPIDPELAPKPSFTCQDLKYHKQAQPSVKSV
ncbi:unnamed protein product [Linum trigynum]|uniref:Uncharacterized protein n=1 Tax=Linum trigynum TaxID=586398 RepID=A0AAV2DY84_9ROSI